MPTTYTGDQTQTQLPSNPPEPEGTIQVSLPVDLDPDDGATFEQAFKVLADFIDWCMKPRAAANVWEKAILPFRAAIGHRRFAIDHVGFPTGQVMVHDINWRSSSVTAGTQKFGADAGSVYGAMPDWTYKSVNATGTAYATMGPSVFGPALGILAGEALNDYVTVKMMPLGPLRADNHVVFETSACVPAQNSLRTHIALCDDPSTTIVAASDFIGWRVTGAGAWVCVTKAAGVETVTTTAIAAAIGGARGDRLRIEWSGETVADDATRCCRFYINGIKEAEHFTNLPLNMLAGPAISQVRVSAAAGGDTLVIGPGRFRMSLSELDTVL